MPRQGKSIETISDLIEVLQALGYEIKDPEKSTGSKVIILIGSGINRVSELEKIAKLLGGEYAKNVAGSSAGGAILRTQQAKSKKFVVLAKPKSRQGTSSAGIENEQTIIQNIKGIIELTGEPVDILLTDGKRRFLCKSVVDVVDAGRDTKGRKKADIILIGDKRYPISIKKDNAGAWESADTYWRTEALTIINKLQSKRKVKLLPIPGKPGVNKIEPEIVVECNDVEIRDFVFGSDLLPNGCVIQRTFSSSDFHYDGDVNLLSIDVSHIIRDMVGAKDPRYIPKMLMRNDSSRVSPKGIPGIRILSIFGKRGNALVVPLSER